MSYLLEHSVIPPKNEARFRGWILFLHGILGSGSNWRAIAKKVVDESEDVGAVLVDLRLHGKSQLAPPPHTLDACVTDLGHLEQVLDGPVIGVSGHSFGSKVALAYGASRQTPLEHLWFLDGDPGARVPAGQSADGVGHVFAAIDDLPVTFASRSDFTSHLEAKGLGAGVIGWLGMNLDRTADGLVFRLDVPAIRQLLADYHDCDLWSALEDPVARNVQVVLGEHSEIATRSLTHRLDGLQQCHPGRIQVTTIASAGHWLHVDQPQALLEVFSTTLSR